jgi:hypothetical protein
VDEGTNGTGTATKSTGYVGIGQIAVEAEHHGSALSGRKLGECVLQLVRTEHRILNLRRRLPPCTGDTPVVRCAGMDDTSTDIGKWIAHPRPMTVQSDEAVLDEVGGSVSGAAQEGGQSNQV